MTLKRQLLIPLGCIGVAALLGATWKGGGDSAPLPPTSITRPAPIAAKVTLDIEAPEPLGTSKDYGEKQKCTTGCSLAKHAIAPFTVEQFHTALSTYAKHGVDEPRPALEKLLFYGVRTLALMKEHGTGKLPAEHLAFLKRELSRQRVTVSMRMVDSAGRVRINLAPVVVPIGDKRHLHPPALDGTQPMSINGTVMRTGLHHIWSRY